MTGRQRTFTVALIGPDGAGKSTISQRVVEQLQFPVKKLYMGVNLESSNLVLPTTRLWLELKRLRGRRPDSVGPPSTVPAAQQRSGMKTAVYNAKSLLRLGYWTAEEWFRQLVAWSYQWRGYAVLFDRHFFTDYYAHDITGERGSRTLASRLHGAMLGRFYPRPDLCIMLDAPADVLLARKGEGTLESLEARRQDYLAMDGVLEHFAVVSAEQPLEDAIEEVVDVINEFARTRTLRAPARSAAAGSEPSASQGR